MLEKMLRINEIDDIFRILELTILSPSISNWPEECPRDLYFFLKIMSTTFDQHFGFRFSANFVLPRQNSKYKNLDTLLGLEIFNNYCAEVRSNEIGNEVIETAFLHASHEQPIPVCKIFILTLCGQYFAFFHRYSHIFIHTYISHSFLL